MDQIPSLNDRISALLKSAIEDSPLFKANIDIPPFDALCLSLQHTSDWRASDSLFEFLDNCLQRLVKRPVKYYEDCTELTSSIRHDHAEVENHRIDLLLITILEQWPFLTGSDAISVENIARWLARYLDLLMQAGGCVIVLSNIRDRIMSHDDKMLQWIFKNVLKESSKYGMHSELKNLIKSSLRTSDHEVVVHSPTSCPTLDEVLVSTRPPIEGKDHLALRSIRRKAVVDAIIDGDVGELVQYLCSEHEDIRIQALANLQSFLIKLKVTSSFSTVQTRLTFSRILVMLSGSRSMFLLGKLLK